MDEYYLRTGVKVISMCFGGTDTTLLFKDKFGGVDNVVEEQIGQTLSSALPIQKVESAAKAVVEACRIGASGSTWLAIYDKPARDITHIVKARYETMAQAIDPNF